MATAYITCPRERADALARTLVEERLAACVNALACDSTYRWEDEVVTDQETVLLCKTTDAGYEALASRVRELHPYEVPCIECFDETAIDAPFGDWIEESVEAP